YLPRSSCSAEYQKSDPSPSGLPAASHRWYARVRIRSSCGVGTRGGIGMLAGGVSATRGAGWRLVGGVLGRVAIFISSTRDDAPAGVGVPVLGNTPRPFYSGFSSGRR